MAPGLGDQSQLVRLVDTSNSLVFSSRCSESTARLAACRFWRIASDAIPDTIRDQHTSVIEADGPHESRNPYEIRTPGLMMHIIVGAPYRAVALGGSRGLLAGPLARLAQPSR
jgi:hypothetical protein